MQGRASRSKARNSTRADAALPHGSADATVHVPELGAQAAAPGRNEFTALAEQFAFAKAESDASQASTFTRLDQMRASQAGTFSRLDQIDDNMRSMIALLNSKLPAATPPAAPAATPTLHQQQIAHAKQSFDEKATFDAAVAAAVEQVIAARDAAASPPLRAASYSSAAAPRAPAGFWVPAPPPPPPPTTPAFSYVHSLSTNRPVPAPP